MDKKGKKIQVKSGRFSKYRQSRHMGIIRNLEDKKFDYLIAILFDNEFKVIEA